VSECAFCTAVAIGVGQGATELRCKSSAFQLTSRVGCRLSRSRPSSQPLRLQKFQPSPHLAQSLRHLQQALSQPKCRPTPHLFRSRPLPLQFGITPAFICTSQTGKPVAGPGDAELESPVGRTAHSNFAVNDVRKWKIAGISISLPEEAASFSQAAAAQARAREPSTGRLGEKKSHRSPWIKKGNCSINVFSS